MTHIELDVAAHRSPLVEAVRAILCKVWDPIRIQELPPAYRIANADEYDAYVEEVVGMVLSGANTKTLADHLRTIETTRMGQRARGRTTAAAAMLAELVKNV